MDSADMAAGVLEGEPGRPSPAPFDLVAVFAALPTPTALFAADTPRFTVLAASDTLLAATRRPREAVIGRPAGEAFPNASPEDSDASGLTSLRASLEAAVRTGAPQEMPRQRYDLPRPDGVWEERYWNAVNVPLPGPGHAVAYVLHQTEDITVRLRADEALRASEERLRLAVSATGLGVFDWDLATDLVTVNARFREMFGLPEGDDVIGAGMMGGVVHGEDRTLVEATLAAAFAPQSSGAYELEHRALTPSGEVWLLTFGQVFFAGEGDARRPIRVVGNDLDITERKRVEVEREDTLQQLQAQTVELEMQTQELQATAVELEAQVEATGRAWQEAEVARAAAESEKDRAETARREADEANQAKSNFLATMSHELRTPLNAIIGYAQLLELGLAGALSDQQRSFLVRMAGSGQHLLTLVNDVLDLAKIEAGETRVAHDNALIGAATQAGLDLVRPQAESRGVRLLDERPNADDVPYVGDSERTRQIVVNLLSNAVKFTGAGGTVTLTSGVRDDTPPEAGHLQGAGPWAFVDVADTGLGVPVEEQGRIFEPFRQVQGRNIYTREHGGTGLGLAISRRLARLMGGDLTVVSDGLGSGSTFTLWLPAARSDVGAPPETAAERRARAEPDLLALEAPRLGQVGELLHEVVDQVVAAYTDRLRADPMIPHGREMRRIQLEDHAMSFLADLGQSLVIVGDAGPEGADLLRDGSAIQRAIAEAHGARRFAQGFDEPGVRRDHQVFRAEVERAVRARLREGSSDVEGAVQVLLGLIDRAESVSVQAWRRAAAQASRVDR